MRKKLVVMLMLTALAIGVSACDNESATESDVKDAIENSSQILDDSTTVESVDENTSEDITEEGSEDTTSEEETEMEEVDRPSGPINEEGMPDEEPLTDEDIDELDEILFDQDDLEDDDEE